MTPAAAHRALAVPGVGVRIEAVNLSYGDNHVLKSIDLEIRPGEFFAFLGPSGCGKTTLLRLIAGFNRADSGRVLVWMGRTFPVCRRGNATSEWCSSPMRSGRT